MRFFCRSWISIKLIRRQCSLCKDIFIFRFNTHTYTFIYIYMYTNPRWQQYFRTCFVKSTIFDIWSPIRIRMYEYVLYICIITICLLYWISIERLILYNDQRERERGRASEWDRMCTPTEKWSKTCRTCYCKYRWLLMLLLHDWFYWMVYFELLRSAIYTFIQYTHISIQLTIIDFMSPNLIAKQ